jgi:rhodanese-related sulfurtransferase
MTYPASRRQASPSTERNPGAHLRRRILSAAFCVGTLLSVPGHAGNSPGAPTALAGKCPLLALAAMNRAPTPSAPKVPSGEDSCVVKARALDVAGAEVFDLRERARFLEFHVPGARQATLSELITRPGTSSHPTIVYDGGRFHSDALQLCERLQRAGFRQVHVVDGGIAAWAQLHALPESMALSRLSDTDMAAALSEPGSRSLVLDESLRSALPPGDAVLRPAGAARVILLATATTPSSAIRAQLRKNVTTFYWIGSPQRLRELRQTQLAQDRKRLAGPAVSKACSAL